MNETIGVDSVAKLREAIREAAANGILKDEQLIRYAREAAQRARFCLLHGNRTGAWNEFQLAADLCRAAKPISVPRRAREVNSQ